ncbi:flagellar motor protein MotB [Sphingomonas profundi]|uniref:flagellar motor protein MotB n=1 Tax=Alterirhizorhabdus profundi TaxID=2681549 RepID=UPI0012E88322|nr:flagellar motor protein MotB [Sphingomonas profundi]
MSAARAPRWALSFADLCLLLLGFFVILHAQKGDPRRVAQGMRAAFGDGATAAAAARTDYKATALFQPGEAVLTPAAAGWLARLGREAAARRSAVLIVSDGIDPATARLDGWELAAARAAAVGRAVRAGGVSERQLTISIPAMGGDRHAAGQTLRITATPNG